MNSEGKRAKSNIEEIAASILRMIADGAPATPNKLSPGPAPPQPTPGAGTDLDSQFDLPALVRSLHSLANQISPQKGASNLNDHHTIAGRAPATPSVLSPTHTPPPMAEARSNHHGAFHVPALVQPIPSHGHQHPPQIGASNLNGHRIDWQQHPEHRSHESREMPFDRRRSGWEHTSDVRAPNGAAGLSAPPLRTRVNDPNQDLSQAGGGALKSFSTLPPLSPYSLPSADIPTQVVAQKDALVMGPMGPSRAGMQPGMPLNAVAPPHAPANSFGPPIFPTQFRVPEATPTAPHTGTPKELQGRTETASNKAIPEDLTEKALVELLRPLFKQWLDSNMRSVFERALRVEIERAKNRK